MLDKVLHDFLVIWATIDPIGTMALFAALTAKLPAKKRRKTAFKTVGYAAIVLIGAIVIGQLLLSAMGISLLSFQVAGGIILFLFGLQMIFADDSSQGDIEPQHDISVFPLAIPATASPGAILAVILITDNHIYTIKEQVITALNMLGVLLITLVLLLLSGRILKLIGTGGASILTRIMGLILAALSVEFVMEALGVAKWIASN
ncbi:MarC family protein [Pseudoalteromonas sp. N1230-9]|jgi:multiple antibiotic resistance protein|uniref:MarC family protein n=1 Tax=Pseudoalteromonas TaxID=53246 RepID=UPI000781FF90|nr:MULTISPECIES: MarC family protein [Pseudoalteromonas]RZF90108.1 MarC family protein [Pseudoalteromonas sp. CO302Y]RZG05908.1 MarC family protein [Pseudoalteromonas sp. CO133X]UJX27505.1 MarC family protein [Pseudoalteromonas sp. CF6-2]WOC28262.1 MarC family protein [Pseudoalteromonas sp. N1230-9]MCF7517612.1 MarC family protein [Pseudoalteromonas sp. L21]|tara:strand:+ start:9495 stop:10106 length:612 start_codon:yes stop_codon:yes gene_type:complete